MSFRSRNAYYLQISPSSVLPLYLYLDERHIDWMSDRVLQHVLSDLRPLIVPKLKAEADARLEPGGPSNTKRGTVDVHRGDSWQFAFFFRKTEPHSVLIKTRTFIAAPPKEKEVAQTPNASRKTGKREGQKLSKKRSASQSNVRKKRKTKGKAKAKATVDDESDEAIAISSGESSESDLEVHDVGDAPRRSGRPRNAVAGGYQETTDDIDGMAVVENAGVLCNAPALPQSPPSINPAQQPNLDAGLLSTEQAFSPSVVAIKDEDEEMPLTDTQQTTIENDFRHPETASNAGDIELEIEEEEAKPKPLLRLKYRGFNIYGRCLCVIVEPWPPFPSRIPSVAPLGGVASRRERSVAPSDFVPSGEAAIRARTPLFLPDFDREASATPAPFAQQRTLPPVPLFNDLSFTEDEDEEGNYDDTGLMEFSQALNTVGEYRAGVADDDDEMDGAVFFGDADEAREL